ncbi:hypothetical protein DYBT9275_06093 [Dyadobacter sp. CECT 9275]|uniref:FecR family protein n=1 Tax=Dyadobacter helix TaxID=2822344 RepID=A0A916JKL2_9BACT|nr:FecR domain-containing protein [Dyadobacter sp. CECT 9275]CAG5018894.1 hypothetical protein DYBT9275_06093 [Dyadobacter sp. CECT 9275]
MKKQVNKHLLFDFFSEKTTLMQRKLIEEWLEDSENQELYYKYLDEWEAQHPQFFPDLDKALQTYQFVLEGEISSKEGPEPMEEVPMPEQNRGRWWLLRGLVAASVLFAALFLYRKELMYQSLKSAAGHSSTYRLPDGTQVILNVNSELLIPRFGFGRESREVILFGEANFNVTHTRSHTRFVVNMGDHYQVEVLGTEFVAYSRKEGKRVFLSRGKVKLQLPEGKQLYMKPGNLFSSAQDGTFKVSTPVKPQELTAWKEQMFYFDNTLLSDVARQMEERFNVNVRISDPLLSARRIGGIYRAENADDLLQILSELLPIEIIQNQDYIELRIPQNP